MADEFRVLVADAMSFVVGDGRENEGERVSEDDVRADCVSTCERVIC